MTKKNYRGRRRSHPLLTLLLILLFAAFAVCYYDSNYRLQTDFYTAEFENLPEGFDGCRIVQLTDLHGARFGDDNADLLAAVAAAQPDYIFLTGDMLDRFRETPQGYAVDLCAALMEIAPTYLVTGNHEWALGSVRELKAAVAETGAVVLSNEFVTLERDGDVIVLAGIDDPNGFADQKTPEELAEELYEAYDDPFWILLAHRNNRFLTQYSLLGADLVMSGHAHGGLIRLPFTDGLVGVERDLFPSYTAGFYEENGSTLLVSRGLGNSGRTFRLFNRPEIVVLTLTRDAS